MDESISIVGRQFQKDVCRTPRKRPKYGERNENYHELLSVPRRKAFKEDTSYASRAHMSLKSMELERILDIEFNIRLPTYPEDRRWLSAHIIRDVELSTVVWCRNSRYSGGERTITREMCY